MSDLDNTVIEVNDDELTLLKEQADLMGIKYAKNVSVDVLRKKVADALGADSESKKADQPQKEDVEARRKELTRLRRVRISCHDPMKSQYDGEIFSVMNALGSFTRYVQFGVPWHVEQILLNNIENAEYQQFTTVKDGKGETQKKRTAKTYSVEYLEPLTQEGLDALGKDQTARRAID